MRAVVFILSAVVQLGASAAGFLLLILALNGFGGREAEPGLLFYVVSSAVSALGLGAASAFTAGRLAARRSLGRFAAASIAVAAFAAVGVVVVGVSFLAAVLIAQAMHGAR